MKKSKNVPATLVAAMAALALAGCSSGPTEVRRCVDDKGNVIPDSVCGGTGGSGYTNSYYHTPHWIYGGRMIGGRMSGFSTTPTEGSTITDGTGHTVSRGGFGGGGSGGGS